MRGVGYSAREAPSGVPGEPHEPALAHRPGAGRHRRGDDALGRRGVLPGHRAPACCEEVDASLDQAWRTIEANPRAALGERGLLDVYVVQVVEDDGDGASSPPAARRSTRVRDRPGVADGTADRSYDTVVDADAGERAGSLSVGLTRRRYTLQVARSLEENERVLHDLRNRTILLVVVVDRRPRPRSGG